MSSILTSRTMLFKKILMPCGLCAAVPAIKANASTLQESMPLNIQEPKDIKLIRPSELPIYTFEDDYCKQSPCNDSLPPSSMLEQHVSKVRILIQTAVTEYHHYTGVISDTLSIGYEHSSTLLDYLREESNIMPRMGAIGIGGLAGLILGLRGRTFKRIVYSSTGALTMAAICYPKKAEEGFEMAKYYVRVGYYFVHGVKPDDEKELGIKPQLPDLKIPTSFSEFVDLTVDTSSMIAGVVVDFVSNTFSSLGTKQEDTKPSTKLATEQD